MGTSSDKATSVAIGADPTGAHVTLTPAIGGFAVCYLDDEEDVTDTYQSLTEAAQRYEEQVRDFGPRADGLDADGNPLWDDTDVDFSRGSWIANSDGHQRTESNTPVTSQPQGRPFSGHAIAGFILSLLWLGGLGGLGSLAGLFMCVTAMRESRDGQRAGQGLAVAGLILGILGLIPEVIILVTWAAANLVG